MLRPGLRPVDVLAIILFIASMGAAGIRFCAPVRALAIIAAGNSTGCPFRSALAVGKVAREHRGLEERFRRSSRVVRTDPAGFQLWQTPKGRLWTPAGADPAFLLAEQARAIYGRGEQGVRAGDTVLDCGAHVGVFVREALARGARMVVAIEPSPRNLVCLGRNLHGEIAAGRVVVVDRGVADREGMASFRLEPADSGSDMVVPEARYGDTRVQLTTLDRLVDNLALGRVDFIKMDIEGSERRALAGAQLTLRRFKPRLALAAYHRPDDVEKLPALAKMAHPGYRMTCGPCGELNFRILPETLLFQ